MCKTEKNIMQQENNKYRDLIKISESAAEHCMDAILNEFFFFCTFSKGLSSQDFLYRKLVGNPYSKYPALHALYRGFKGYARTLLRFVLNRIISKGPIIAGKIESTTNVLIVTWLHDANILQNDRIDKEDKYFGSLGARLKEQGYNIQYLLFPVRKQVANNSMNTPSLNKNLLIYERHIRPSFDDLTSSLYSISKSFSFDMRIDERISYVSGFHSPRYIISLQLCKILANKFKGSNVDHIIIPWEAQPEQKAICLAAHSTGIKVWGYCHAAINGSYVHLINNNWAWCPDIMLVNGFGYVPLLEDMGWKDKTWVIRSLRYPNPPERKTFEGKAFLPFDIKDSIHTLKILKTMSLNDHCIFKEIRCHPDNLNNSEIRTLMRDIPTHTNATDVYVGGFTSVLFEALQAGCTVYNIQTDILQSEDAYRKFNEIKVTRLNQYLLKFEPIGDMKDYFFCFDEDRSFKLPYKNA